MKRTQKMAMILAVLLTFSCLISTSYAVEKTDDMAFYEQCIEETQAILSAAEENIPVEIQDKMDAQSDALIAYEKLISTFEIDDENQFIYPSDYAGAYIDESGMLVIQTTSQTAEAEQKYIDLTEEEDIQVEHVQYSMEYLESLEDQITSIEASHNVLGFHVDVRENKFVVEVDESPIASPARAIVASEGISGIELEAGVMGQACSSIYGGDTLYNSTSQFSVCFGGTYNGSPAILTCGHGNNEVGTQVKWKTTSYVLGSVVKQRITSATNYTTKCSTNPLETYGDFSIVKVTSGDTPTAYVRVSSSSSYYANGTYSTVPEGTYVYKYGSTTKYSYGLVGQTGCVYTYTTNDTGTSPLKCRGLTQVTMVAGDVTDQYINSGDSGGCVFLKVNGSYKISGLVTAKPGSGSTAYTVMYYTPIGYATEAGFQIAS